MSLRFTVLGSGSGGNASFLEAGDFGLLLDIGLGPRQLARRLAAAGACWSRVRAVLLTHTHGDHWNDRTLAYLQRLRVPIYCHAGHHAALLAYSMAFGTLLAQDLVRPYREGEDLVLAPSCRCRPLPVRHDGGATFGFRLEGAPDFYGQSCALAYAADLGCWNDELAESLAGVDLLALEFNHDVSLERASGRSRRLITRVLGDDGHLSNEQAAALLGQVLRRSAPGRVRHLVQLHLSRDCNRPELAAEAARQVVAGLNADLEIHTASQDDPLPTVTLGFSPARLRAPRRGAGARAAKTLADPAVFQPWLPGLEG